MNAESARIFLPTLREIERELSLPVLDRVRILRELEYDLEELRARFLAEGVPPEEARSRALETLVPDRRSLQQLATLHGPLYIRIVQQMGRNRLRALERSALVLAAGLTLAVQTVALLHVDLLGDPSPFIWPVLALGTLLGVAILVAGHGLFLKRDHKLAGRGLKGILVLAGGILTAGLWGAFADFYRMAGLLEGSPALADPLVRQWLVRDCGLLAVAVFFSLAGGLVWFVLNQWLALINGAHRDLLGLGR